MFKRTADIGLDIGSNKIKLAKVKKKKCEWQLIKYGCIDTPPGLVEAGNIFVPEEVGAELAKLVIKLGLAGQRVVSAVSGQQVYIRNMVLPRMSLSESREAAVYQAVSFLPIPIEEAAIDVFPWRDFKDEDGDKSEFFFAAVPRIQVENLELVCLAAGLKLAAVEIEPLAINRIMLPPNASGVRALLQIGASRSYFSVFRDQNLLFYRTLSSFYKNIGFMAGTEKHDIGLHNIQEKEFKNIVRDLFAEVGRSVDYYNNRHSEEKLEKIWLCGGGGHLKGLDEVLAKEISCEVQVADFLSRLILPAYMDESARQEINHNFPVALGLAAREVI
ncbi:MAG: type IV pilus assembly protein PilM [Syntrophomonadaceae bacterium]|nr:type IV pilus assembly protein PilM [Syntrophomonadaceae bacterium]